MHSRSSSLLRDSALRHGEAGQAVVEYVMLLVVVAGLSSILFRVVPEVLATLEKPLKSEIALIYRNGDPKACTPDDSVEPCTGSFFRHPKVYVGENFRMFGRGDALSDR